MADFLCSYMYIHKHMYCYSAVLNVNQNMTHFKNLQWFVTATGWKYFQQQSFDVNPPSLRTGDPKPFSIWPNHLLEALVRELVYWKCQSVWDWPLTTVASVVVVLLLLGEGHVHVHRGHVMGTTAARVSSDRQTWLASEHTPSCLAFPPSLCHSLAYLLLIHFFTLTESYISRKMKDLFAK